MTEHVERLIAEMTLPEKVSLLAGEDAWHLAAVERLGVPRLKMTDGPNGARGADWTAGPRSACFPCGSALAATFDRALLQEVGAALAAEAKAKGAHVLLGPTVNIHRHPLAGRHFECYSEDPELTAQLAVAYIKGVQSGGVSACVKHFVANDSEFERFSISSEVPERALREIYLRPFEAAVTEGGTWSIMSAYNRVGGTFASEHQWLLTDLLRDEWGFEGFVVSDWGGTHSTSEAANAGLTVEMPGPTKFRGDLLVQAVERGEVDRATIDALAGKVLAVAERTGCLAQGDPPPESGDDSPARRDLARRAATAGIVLLKNDAIDGSPLLPFSASALKTVAVLGPNSDPARIQGGGSAGVTPYYEVTPLEAISGRLGPEATVIHERGCEIARTIPHIDARCLRSTTGEHALDIAHYAGEPGAAEPVLTQVVRRIPGGWNQPPPGIDLGNWSMRLSGGLSLPTTGDHTFKVRSNGAVTVRLDGEVAAESDGGPRGSRAEFVAHLVAGEEHRIEIDIGTPDEIGFAAGFDIRHQAPVIGDPFADAVAAAAAADVAVVVVGTDNDWETEGRDRDSLELPGRQAELIRAVARANPRTVVVLNAGAPVDLGWMDEVPSAVQLWFAGQEAGNALADVLFGDANPSGRLPTTIPRSLADTPAYDNYPGEFGEVRYGEGLHVGYRWYDARGIEPALPFGHGLSYTTFAYSGLRTDADGTGNVVVEVDVRNTRSRAGAEVVQLYVGDVAASVARPPKELKAFERVDLDVEEQVTVRFEVEQRTFPSWNPPMQGWRVGPGRFALP
ncbi:MAG: glycoside hydrolase family 3 C-terminal domain-containing protein, partial [Acidimicrobiales bacterium]